MPAILKVTGELLEVKPNQAGTFASFSIKSMNNDGQKFTFQNGKTFDAASIEWLSSLQIGSQVEITGEMRNEAAQVKNEQTGQWENESKNGKQVYKQTLIVG